MGTGNELIGRMIPSFGGGGLMDIILAIVLGSLGLAICGGVLWYFLKRKMNWNLRVEFKLPRNIKVTSDEDGNEVIEGTIRKEWGKGYYNAKEGVVYIKRKRKLAVAMKPFNIKEFLSDNDILTVIQVGAEDYRPVLEDSYLNVKDYYTGEEAALINAKIDTSESKAWKSSYERERKATFTLMSWLAANGQVLAFGFLFLCIFVGFAIVLGKLPG